MEKRIGNQNPTHSFVLSYEKTLGQEAIDIFNKGPYKAQPWQEKLIQDIMAINEDGLWTHNIFGYSIPRRNGKSDILKPIMIWHVLQGHKVMYTAHRTTTSHSMWERTVELLSKIGYKESKPFSKEKGDFSTLKKFGLENIAFLNGEGVATFRTRSSKGGLGEGYDVLIIDEAQEYTDDQASALKYVVTDSKNPQTIMLGTPPTTVSSGTVFMNLRDNILAGKGGESGWCDWSVEKQTNPHDKDAWYLTNPSLGTVFTERSILAELSQSEDEIDFNIQRLGLWLKYNLKSLISLEEWMELKSESKPKLQGNLFVGIKFGSDGVNVSMSLACKTYDGKVFVEAIDCVPIRQGDKWIIDFLLKIDNHVEKIVIDGANGQQRLSDELSEFRTLKNKLILPKVKEVVIACALFENAFYQKTITHNNQPSLTRCVSNCDKRPIGSNGGFGFKSIKEDVDISLMESMVFAHWQCSEQKEKKKQRISY